MKDGKPIVEINVLATRGQVGVLCPYEQILGRLLIQALLHGRILPQGECLPNLELSSSVSLHSSHAQTPPSSREERVSEKARSGHETMPVPLQCWEQ